MTKKLEIVKDGEKGKESETDWSGERKKVRKKERERRRKKRRRSQL